MELGKENPKGLDLLRWRNLIGSLSRDIVFVTGSALDGRLVTLMTMAKQSSQYGPQITGTAFLLNLTYCNVMVCLPAKGLQMKICFFANSGTFTF